jgi:hypothetical protein
VDVKEQDVLGPLIGRHWYYAAKGNALLQFLAGRTAHEVLDIGAGDGFFSRRLLEAGVCRRAICVDTAYQAERSELHCGRPIAFVRSTGRTTQDLVLMMDVIEHVEDDVAFVRAYVDSMPRDAVVLVTVPAFQALWSGHDVFLEHKRRYTMAGLRRTLEKAGLEVTRCRYFFSALLPAIAAMRLWGRIRLSSGRFTPRSDLRVHAPWSNALLLALHEVERHTLFRVNRLAGLTIFCLARKA